jgi:plastocyanin
MRKFVFGLMGLMLLCAFALAACGESSVAASPTDTAAPALPTATTAPAPTATTGGNASAGVIGMGVTTFSHASTTIKVGQSVTFLDPSDSGGVHNIVTGSAGKFAAQAGTPSAFATADGVNFAPGDSQTFTFTAAGTYTFTCTIHPNMRATVTVKP